jgi:ATP synthase protein I
MPSANNDDKKEQNLAPTEKQAAGFSRQFAMAMELPFVIVGTIVFAGFIGYLLDRWLHTRPFLMLIFGFLGFFGGLRDVLRRLAKE